MFSERCCSEIRFVRPKVFSSVVCTKNQEIKIKQKIKRQTDIWRITWRYSAARASTFLSDPTAQKQRPAATTVPRCRPSPCSAPYLSASQDGPRAAKLDTRYQLATARPRTPASYGDASYQRGSCQVLQLEARVQVIPGAAAA